MPIKVKMGITFCATCAGARRAKSAIKFKAAFEVAGLLETVRIVMLDSSLPRTTIVVRSYLLRIVSSTGPTRRSVSSRGSCVMGR